MFEHYDHLEPPPMEVMFHEEDVDTAWSNLYKGQRVRWKTPQWVKRGEIVVIRGRSMRVQFDYHSTPTALPDAKWYFVQGKLGNKEEHLVAINSPKPSSSDIQITDTSQVYLTPQQAADAMGTDPKHIRRLIRSGKLAATRVGGRWAIPQKAIE